MKRAQGPRQPRVRAVLWILGFLFQAVASGPIHAGEASSRLIVRYLGEGPAAVEECGVRLHELGDHAAGTADRSDSLDRLHRRFGVRRVRALLRNGEAGSMEDHRTLLERRARESRDRLRTDRSPRRSGPPSRAGRTNPRAASRQAPSGAEAAADESLRTIAGRLAHVYEIELEPGADARVAADAYSADPHVAWAQVDGARVLDAIGDDPFLSSRGSWGQPYADMWGHERIRAQEAWDDGRGEGVVVAVVDTGLDWYHEDIAENVWVHPGEDLDGNGRVDADDWNGLDDDGNGYIDDLVGFDFANSIDENGDGDYVDPEDTSDADPFDDNGHGTHVAGIVAATADNGEGIAGVAPAARIMALKGFKADGENSDALLWRAVLYAALNGAHVVNNSWSCGAPCPRNPLAEEVVELVHAMGVVIVTSAGNRSRDVVAFSPENMWQTLTVGSSNVFDAPSSSFTNHGFGMDVLAPGGDPQDTRGVFVPRRNILSLRSSAADPNQAPFVVGERYIRQAGTSMAAPQVAGAVALLLSQRPWLDPDSIRRMIRRSALDLDRPGHDHATGAGRLDARALLDEPDPPDWTVRVVSPRPSSWFDPTSRGRRARGHDLGPRPR